LGGDSFVIRFDETDRDAKVRGVVTHLKWLTGCSAYALRGECHECRTFVGNCHPQIDSVGTGNGDITRLEHRTNQASAPGVLDSRVRDRHDCRLIVEHLQQYGISQMPVSEDATGDAVVGIVGSINERSLLDRAFRDPSIVERTVGEVMDGPLPLVDASATLDEAFTLLSGASTALVAVRGEQPAGIITKLDLLEYLTHLPGQS